jgi:hypothetical protein
MITAAVLLLMPVLLTALTLAVGERLEAFPNWISPGQTGPELGLRNGSKAEPAYAAEGRIAVRQTADCRAPGVSRLIGRAGHKKDSSTCRATSSTSTTTCRR